MRSIVLGLSPSSICGSKFCRHLGLVLVLLSAVLFFPGINFAGSPPPAKEAEQEVVTPSLPKGWMESLNWRCIGPANMGGRITAISVYEKDPSTFWVGTASGGLLKTTNNGITFEHQFDRENTASVGDVKVAPSDPKIVWVGTGEANPRNSVSWGDGVYKSEDGGTTWKRMGLEKSFQIGRIAIHPENPDVVYVGALGRLWGPNEDRGLYKTEDGGASWEKILWVDDRTGVIDVQLKPGEPETLIVATYERQRDGFDTNDPAKKWGRGSGLHRSTDGGKTFVRLTSGLPKGRLGRIGIDYFRSDPNVVYAVVESEKITQEPENAAYLGVRGEDAEVGARLTEITEGGAAEEAGLEVGDIVIRVEDRSVLGYRDLVNEIRKRLAGDTVEFEFARDRKVENVEVTFKTRPDSEEDKEATAKEEKDKEREKEKKESKEEEDQRRRRPGPFSSGLGGQRENVQDQQGPEGVEYGGVYRSEDGGSTWTRINSVNPRPMYYSQIRVDPSDRKHLAVLGTSLYRSSDGGETFSSDGARRGVHVDHHALWIDPKDGRHMILGNDGGLYVTYDRMENWDHYNHFAIGQFYRVTVDSTPNYMVYGGLQDNGSWGGPNRVRNNSGPINEDWIRVGGGDGFFCRVDRDDSDLVYGESQNGGLFRRHLAKGDFASLRPRAPRGTRYRFNWNTPFLLSHHNTKIYYTAGNYVFRSFDRGNGVKAISPEITPTDKGSATALAESPLDPRILYVGTDDGGLWMTEDGGHEWVDLFESASTGSEDDPESPEEEAPTEEPGDEADAEAEVAGEGAPEVRESAPDPLVGEWKGKATGEGIPDDQGRFTFEFKRNDEGDYDGWMSTDLGEGELVRIRRSEETGKVSFEFPIDQMTMEFSGALEGPKQIAGKIEVGGGMFSMDFVADRVEADPPTPTASGPGGADPRGRDGEVSAGKGLDVLLPGRRWVSSLWASRFEKNRIYVTFDGHRSDDDSPYVFVSEDSGRTWKSLQGNLPRSAGTTRVVVEDLENPEVLYLGAEFSGWVSIDRGESWSSFRPSGLPTVAIHDYDQHPTSGELIAATHGRSVWILDVTPLRQVDRDVAGKDLFLYQPNPAILWRGEPSRGSGGNRRYVGENPTSGAVLYYSLGEPAARVRLEVRTLADDLIREFEASGEAGLHRVVWDLRRPAPEGNRGRRFRRGRRVEPGRYRVVLTVGETTVRKELEVRIDPEFSDPAWLEFEAALEEFEAGDGEEADSERREGDASTGAVEAFGTLSDERSGSRE